ncbi:hypothetical protein STVA_38190 [Allostella vacuolata]|nr:hypothetical protein STVA_38190 [Stella vacuolata]
MPSDAPSPPIDPALIQQQGRQLHGFALGDARATELAIEVARIQERMAAAMPDFWFFDEPVQFLAELDALACAEDGQ